MWVQTSERVVLSLLHVTFYLGCVLQAEDDGTIRELTEKDVIAMNRHQLQASRPHVRIRADSPPPPLIRVASHPTRRGLGLTPHTTPVCWAAGRAGQAQPRDDG